MPPDMRIALAADHAGYSLKEPVAHRLGDLDHAVTDFGTHNTDPVDFPDIVLPVCHAVIDGAADRGILLCGSGIGACMAANKVAGIRAALCHDVHSAHQAVEHDDANIMCLGAKIIGEWLALDLIETFLDARFDGAEHYLRRIAKMADIESSRLP